MVKLTQLRQVAVTTDRFQETVKELEHELESFVTFRDPLLAHFGLENALLPIGRQFLEVVSPLEGQEDSAPAGRYMKQFGAGGYMILVQVVNQNAIKHAYEVAKRRGVPVVHEGARSLPSLQDVRMNLEQGPGINEDGIAGFHLHPKMAGCLAEIAVQRPAHKWAWAGNDWLTPDQRLQISHVPTIGIHSVEIATPQFQEAADLWAEMLQINEDHVAKSDDKVQLTLGDDSILEFRKPVNPTENGLSKIILYTHSPRKRDYQEVVVSGSRLQFIHPFGDSHL